MFVDRTIIVLDFADLLAYIRGAMLGTSYVGRELLDLCGPLVYLLVRGDRAMYIGSSSLGAGRPFTHLPGRDLIESDSLTFIPCSTAETALELESNLIRILQPDWNVVGVKQPTTPLARAALRRTRLRGLGKWSKSRLYR